ncbi:MAG: hypothetical protein HY711_07040, partial [Candidatus Melainabacteria bacterium]|nr:hypothetical protein [Candidatus Melainabacteria bacterium]
MSECLLASFLVATYPVLAHEATVSEAGGASGVCTDHTHIDADALGSTNNLSVSSGTTAVIDFSNSSNISVTGDFVNAGAVYFVSGNTEHLEGTLSAQNITNQYGGLLTSVLPEGGLCGHDHLIPGFSMGLDAVNNIINSGSIISAGNLTVSAGGSISNILPPNMDAMQSIQSPLMQALNNVNLNVSMLNNVGTIEAIRKNINITSTQFWSEMNNINGQIKALNGAINIHELNEEMYSWWYPFLIYGGDLLSREFNSTSKMRILDVNVCKLTGLVNVTGLGASVVAATPDLKINSFTISVPPELYLVYMDPLFANSAGHVTLSGDLVMPGGWAPLGIVASGDIRTSKAGINIASNGNELLMVAGAQFEAKTTEWGTYLNLTGASATGGSIMLTGDYPIASLSTSALPENQMWGTGGTLMLIAYHGTGGGYISLPSNVAVNVTARDGVNHGDVIMIAGAPMGTAISVGNITAGTSWEGWNGNITLAAATPEILGGNADDAVPTMKIYQGLIDNFSWWAVGEVQNSSISTGMLEARQNITLISGGTINMEGALSHNGSVSVTSSAPDKYFLAPWWYSWYPWLQNWTYWGDYFTPLWSSSLCGTCHHHDSIESQTLSNIQVDSTTETLSAETAEASPVETAEAPVLTLDSSSAEVTVAETAEASPVETA